MNINIENKTSELLSTLNKNAEAVDRLKSEINQILKKDCKFIYERIGVKIKKARISKGITQENLAYMLGVDRTSIIGFEKGKQRIPLDRLYVLAKVLGVSISEIFKEIEEE